MALEYIPTKRQNADIFTKPLDRFSDLDWVGNADDRKNITGGCFYIGANRVAWMSKKQNFVSLSIAEAEYIAVGSCFS